MTARTVTPRTVRPWFAPLGPRRASADQILIEREQVGDVCLLRFKGPLEAGGHSDYLKAKMDEIETLGCTKVLADFEDVPVVGSTGLTFIVGLYRACGGRLVLARTQPLVREALDITRLSTLILLVADVESGLAALSGDGLTVCIARAG